MTTAIHPGEGNTMQTDLASDHHDRTEEVRLRESQQSGNTELGPALRAVALVARPRVGWALAALGIIGIIVAWAGVSGEIFVARQVPYLVSGGLGGIALIVLAGVLLGTHDLYGYAARLDRVEQKVDDIHRVLVMAWEDRAATSIDIGETVGGGLMVAALPKGTSYHRLDCAAVQGKAVDHLPAQEAVRLGLSSCKLCDPPNVPVTTLPA